MIILSGEEEQEAIRYFDLSKEVALRATCLRDKCGSVIVKEGRVIGIGYNSPPRNLESQRRCLEDKTKYHIKVKDTTCCVHAEQRAIMDALRNHHLEIIGSRLYFIRLDEKGNATKAGKPYCTICSKMSLDGGLAEFVLWHEEGITVYGTEEYNRLSFEYER